MGLYQLDHHPTVHYTALVKAVAAKTAVTEGEALLIIQHMLECTSDLLWQGIPVTVWHDLAFYMHLWKYLDAVKGKTLFRDIVRTKPKAAPTDDMNSGSFLVCRIGNGYGVGYVEEVVDDTTIIATLLYRLTVSKSANKTYLFKELVAPEHYQMDDKEFYSYGEGVGKLRAVLTNTFPPRSMSGIQNAVKEYCRTMNV